MTADDSYELLQVERAANGVVTVRLDHHDRRNVMSAPMTASWARLMGELRTDRSVRAVVVTGNGTAFCSGGDKDSIGGRPDATVAEFREQMMPFYRAWLTIRDLEVPTIAAINGHAIGAGLCLALAADLRYAAAGARLSVPFNSLGMHPGMAATWLLPEVAGLPVARELLLTGRTVSGAEAAELGIVNRVFPDGDLAAEVAAIADSVAACAPIPTQLTKAALASGGHRTFEAALQWEGLAQPVTLATADLHEGLAAAKERRPAHFSGR
ncbi:MAG TPA: enoyl-CoA hydratase-related protein [Sporichthyaceae bacterium]|jgi:enoyl-CoA hydratase